MTESIFKRTLAGEITERPPIWMMRQAGRVLPSYQKLKSKYHFTEMMEDPALAAEVTLLPIHDLGVDAAILFSDILVIPDAMGMKLNFTDKGPVFESPISDGENPLENFTPDRSRLKHIYAAIDEIIKTRPEGTPLIGFCGAPLTVLCYMIDGQSQNHVFPKTVRYLYDNKEQAKKLIEAITELSIEYAVEQSNHGIDAFQLFETHAGLIPSELYKELFFPACKKILNAVRDNGTPVIYFPKGLGAGISDINKDMTDFLSIDWQMSMMDAHKLVDPELGLQGNLDPRVLWTNKESIAAELDKLQEFAHSGRKWIFNLGHGLLPDIPVENVQFAIDWIKSHNWNRS